VIHYQLHPHRFTTPHLLFLSSIQQTMGSVTQNHQYDNHSQMDFSEAASAQEQFARLVQSTDAMSVYTKDMFQHTKEQLEQITRSNSTVSNMSSTSGRSISSTSS
jgi:hypothetical protein